jgi:hypothetical protein
VLASHAQRSSSPSASAEWLLPKGQKAPRWPPPLGPLRMARSLLLLLLLLLVLLLLLRL